MSYNLNAYDSNAKRILSKKQVIANIMKALIPEYKELSINEIYYLIDNNDGDSVTGITEESIENNQKIVNDLIVTPKLPNSNDTIGMYIGIEPQNYQTSFERIYKRAIYYCSRLISRQKDEVFKKSNYDKLKKVYSIWICTNPSSKLKDSILKFSLAPRFNMEKYDLCHDFDYINIIFLNIGDNYDYDTKDILKMLSLIFKKTKYTSEEASDILEKGYNINIESKEVNNMLSFAEGILQEGIQKGIEQGTTLGKIDNAVDNLYNAVNSFHITLDEAIKALNIDKSILKEVKKKYKDKYKN